MAEEVLWRRILRVGVLLAFAVGFAFPLYLLVTVSLKDTLTAFTSPFSVPVDPHWQSYTDVLSGAGIGVNLAAALSNSLAIVAVSCVLLVLVGSVTAYTLARNPGRLANLLYLVFVVGIIVPSQLGIVPMYTWLRSLGLVGSTAGMIVVYVCKQMPLSVFLFTGFFKQLPLSYEEAAAIDGANLFSTFVRVVMPQMKGIVGTAVLLNTLYIWNDLFDQLVFLTGSDVVTLPVAIYSLTFTNLSRWNVIFAAVVISVIPMLILYLFTQKKMMASLAGGLKG